MILKIKNVDKLGMNQNILLGIENAKVQNELWNKQKFQASKTNKHFIYQMPLPIQQHLKEFLENPKTNIQVRLLYTIVFDLEFASIVGISKVQSSLYLNLPCPLQEDEYIKNLFDSNYSKNEIMFMDIMSLPDGKYKELLKQFIQDQFQD